MQESFKSIQETSRNEDWMRRMEMRYSETNDRIKNVCQKYWERFGIKRSLDILNDHRWDAGGFILDQEHKLGYCENPKVGSSTWVSHLYWLIPENKRKGGEKVFMSKATNTPQLTVETRNLLWREFKSKTSNYLKTNAGNKVEGLFSYISQDIFTFTFVRHPVERLISSFLAAYQISLVY